MINPIFAAAGVGSVALLIAALLVILFILVLTFISRYKKCPPDQIMVVFGRTGKQRASHCIHGGAAFVWPVIQDYGFISLRPMQLDVNLQNALCRQNIRISVPSVFTVGISTDESLMGNAANRLLGLRQEAISDLAKDIILGQLRLVIASMTIEQINADRETFLRNVEENVADELNKIGLHLLNVNITDITDESGYIEAIGKRAVAEAKNKARIDVAEEERKGGIGEAEANKLQRVAVAEAEAQALVGEANATRERRIAVKQAEASAQAGEAEADKERRIAVKQAEATAIEGENVSAINIAKSNAVRAEQEAAAYQAAEAAKRVAEAMIRKADFEAEQQAQAARAKMEEEKQRAETIVAAKIDKEQRIIDAEAQAAKIETEARGQAAAIFAKYEAEAKGNFEVLKAKGEGYRRIIESCGMDANAAAKMLLVEKLEEIVRLQTEAISNIKIDKVTVWDSPNGRADGKSSTAGFLSGMMQSLPPIHDVAAMAGIDLPKYLGEMKDKDQTAKNDDAPAAE
ncbi:MAG: flotillin family protein [Lentisphaeria bacterium]|nr:flotillin family protein [Lentisphaeria bacterium]